MMATATAAASMMEVVGDDMGDGGLCWLVLRRMGKK
jgi:hypothetical protein